MDIRHTQDDSVSTKSRNVDQAGIPVTTVNWLRRIVSRMTACVGGAGRLVLTAVFAVINAIGDAAFLVGCVLALLTLVTAFVVAASGTIVAFGHLLDFRDSV